ncbi:hypothetical protein [Capnocytophaga sp.]|uniref:hypothetical protein n=1 Tax=Capnocytophaga sp. TaxID=44737 RepID=UPI0026DD4E34|nr:hypothetical protein [Capnocytophaga sp.]MDO5105504.1 hypothetical protein [Capnocytophaga sp.]
MKKIIFKLLVFIAITISFQGSCSKPEDAIVQVGKTKVIKHNYIVVNSVSNAPVQVEVKYSVFVAENSQNIIKTETFTTPFVIGGEEVKVVYDSIQTIHNKRVVSGYTSLKRDYTPKGGEYLSIKNLSSETLEYCIIGNNKITFDDINNVKTNPLPVYKGTPVLFLLKSNEAVYDSIFVAKYEGSAVHRKRITLKKPILGDITLTAPYSLQEIISLYKQEASGGNTLFLSLEDYVNNRGSMGKNKLFGQISPNETLNNAGQIWFLNLYTGFRPLAGRIDVNDTLN